MHPKSMKEEFNMLQHQHCPRINCKTKKDWHDRLSSMQSDLIGDPVLEILYQLITHYTKSDQ